MSDSYAAAAVAIICSGRAECAALRWMLQAHGHRVIAAPSDGGLRQDVPYACAIRVMPVVWPNDVPLPRPVQVNGTMVPTLVVLEPDQASLQAATADVQEALLVGPGVAQAVLDFVCRATAVRRTAVPAPMPGLIPTA